MWYLATSLHIMSRLNVFLKRSKSQCISYRIAASPEKDRSVHSILIKSFHFKWKKNQTKNKPQPIKCVWRQALQETLLVEWMEKVCFIIEEILFFKEENNHWGETQNYHSILYSLHQLFPKESLSVKMMNFNLYRFF